MLGLRLPCRHKTQDDAEKPFWISFSDMMTALMVLFLVVMTVTLLAVTHTVSQAERMKTAKGCGDQQAHGEDTGGFTGFPRHHP